MAVLFGMSFDNSTFDTSCQNDAADRVKLFVDKKKLVLSNSLSGGSKQQYKLEKNGNMFNGKLYDENNLRTVKVDQKKLHCELQNSSSSEHENNDIDILSSAPVMTCGASVVANVKEAFVNDGEYATESNKVDSETPISSLKNSAEERGDLLCSETFNR